MCLVTFTLFSCNCSFYFFSVFFKRGGNVGGLSKWNRMCSIKFIHDLYTFQATRHIIFSNITKQHVKCNNHLGTTQSCSFASVVFTKAGRMNHDNTVEDVTYIKLRSASLISKSFKQCILTSASSLIV